ncbi:tripartite tricarboxylate transporter substrate binding protein [Ramlibacter sp. G-1-2-2]|uniref:Tripartite tricarboxylate transporter substrate binding protein n=1 Tax=Ramlibacter agri TaxID=2728837 RepID=A0A848H8H5_9BURK|nr:tripartite tricarboxylate transporter substrate binding protein [Ramlibacter agri]NML44843.1 tripartite tricarboxylate transporter substrate binding protein [Ramlibacter agri]
MHALLRTLITAVALAASVLQPALAQDWPTRPVTFLEPYGPGTNLDAITRYLAATMGAQWKQAVVVENKAGANGVIGTEQVARSPADGYTWLFTGPGHFTNEVLMGKVPFDSIKDFKPVARLASVMLVLVVPANSPYKTVKDIIEAAKKHPGKLTYASAGSGSAQHLSAAAFQQAAGVQFLHVPYKTQAAALTDAVAGQVDFTFSALATTKAQIESGRVRALAVTGPRRSQSLPQLPTVAEAGLPGYEFFSFNAVFVPAGTPDAIVRKFSDALSVATRTPEFAELAKAQGFESDFADAQAWTAAVPAEKKKWQDLIRVSGAKNE